ncbi:peptidylprolyl isomerase [Sediminibacterium soli]|uniref:peptidylprolyl isomerase n=1 Tax=Sediminibacterium soli TaxID=2698829 RepID=UPI00137A6B24|nr:peptidylprolyl isomerase [Sediminibacterium soli]NCI47842.1 peptidylprolyl isomerase [Sediminibacterium soli]
MRFRNSVLVLLFFLFSQVTAQTPAVSLLSRKAPKQFRAVFRTTKGDFVLEAYRSWSPLGVDRLYQLIVSGYYNNSLVFRVEPKYVVQFGIAEKYETKKFWYERYIPDEPVMQKHTRGMVAFARDKKNSRSTQLFVDMTDNPKLDTTVRDGVKGFTPVAKVISGMEVVARFYAKYGKQPGAQQIDLYRRGNAYYEQLFPGLDKILSAKIIP